MDGVQAPPPPGQVTVVITRAEWKARRSELKVEATSSAAPGAILTVQGFGAMTYDSRKNLYKLALQTVSSNPRTVTVISSSGGSSTTTVISR